MLFSRPWILRAAINAWPPYWGTGISVVEISHDWRYCRVVMRDHWYNRNALGTHFGGSLYAMCDPHYALLLIALLGGDFLVWDKCAEVQFLRPGRGTLTAEFAWSDHQLQEVRARADGGEKFEPVRNVHVRDASGDTVALVRKVLYVRRRRKH